MIETIKYYNFRCFEDLELEPSPGVTILVGPNATGKTNTLEGIQLLTTGSSFRHATADQLIRHGQNEGSLFLKESDSTTVQMKLTNGKRNLFINGKKRPLKDAVMRIPTILFYPDELFAIKGPKHERRQLFDEFGSQINKTYRTIYQDYAVILKQRNKLLKADYIDDAMLQAWTDSLIHVAQSFYLYRIRLIDGISPYISEVYQNISKREQLDVRYEAKNISVDQLELNDISASKDLIKDGLIQQFELHREREKLSHKTLFGPHYDDVAFYLDGQPAREYGSQGQQRSIILAIKIAFIRYIYDMFQSYPLLLLDDVMSELDETRRHHLFELMDKDIQTVLTTTHLDYFSEEELKTSKIIEYGEDICPGVR